MGLGAKLLVSWYWYGTIISLKVALGAADRLLLGHGRPSYSEGRRTHPEESPNSIRGWVSRSLPN